MKRSRLHCDESIQQPLLKRSKTWPEVFAYHGPFEFVAFPQLPLEISHEIHKIRERQMADCFYTPREPPADIKQRTHLMRMIRSVTWALSWRWEKGVYTHSRIVRTAGIFGWKRVFASDERIVKFQQDWGVVWHTINDSHVYPGFSLFFFLLLFQDQKPTPFAQILSTSSDISISLVRGQFALIVQSYSHKGCAPFDAR
jgi:hypothetical protein